MSLIEAAVFAALGVLSIIMLVMWFRMMSRSVDVHVDRALSRLRCICNDPNEVTVEHGVKRCVYKGDVLL